MGRNATALSLLLAATVTAVSGCQSLSPRTVIDLASSPNPKAALKGMARSRVSYYAANPGQLPGDLGSFFTALDRLIKKVSGVWGEREAERAGKKVYVKYTNNYLSRAVVDFDRGLVTVETLDGGDPEGSLKSAIVTTLLTPGDPRAVDMFSASEVKLSGTPYLEGEVLDHEGQPISYLWRANRFADHLVKNRRQVRTVATPEGSREAHFVQIEMVADHMEIRARKYAPLVERYASEFGVSRNLIYAIIKTESDFNPFAVSSAPAFGLMQVVPTTAGRDAHRYLHGRDGTPTKAELFDPENNIRFGTAYLDLLQDRYLGEVSDPAAREYCVIAAYNGGIGNVLRSFSSDSKQAPGVINGLGPGRVYDRLQARMPDETKRYLEKVLGFKRGFVGA